MCCVWIYPKISIIIIKFKIQFCVGVFLKIVLSIFSNLLKIHNHCVSYFVLDLIGLEVVYLCVQTRHDKCVLYMITYVHVSFCAFYYLCIRQMCTDHHAIEWMLFCIIFTILPKHAWPLSIVQINLVIHNNFWNRFELVIIRKCLIP